MIGNTRGKQVFPQKKSKRTHLGERVEEELAVVGVAVPGLEARAQVVLQLHAQLAALPLARLGRVRGRGGHRGGRRHRHRVHGWHGGLHRVVGVVRRVVHGRRLRHRHRHGRRGRRRRHHRGQGRRRGGARDVRGRHVRGRRQVLGLPGLLLRKRRHLRRQRVHARGRGCRGYDRAGAVGLRRALGRLPQRGQRLVLLQMLLGLGLHDDERRLRWCWCRRGRRGHHEVLLLRRGRRQLVLSPLLQRPRWWDAVRLGLRGSGDRGGRRLRRLLRLLHAACSVLVEGGEWGQAVRHTRHTHTGAKAEEGHTQDTGCQESIELEAQFLSAHALRNGIRITWSGLDNLDAASQCQHGSGRPGPSTAV